MSNKPEKNLEEERHYRQETEQPYGQLKGRDKGLIPAFGFSFRASVDRHAALLADIHSHDLRADLMTQLQQSHGNAYVQRVIERIQARKGSGQVLETQVRAEMESVFKQDFSDVHIHTDITANKLARDLGAKAFSMGEDIFFGGDGYQPGSDVGKGLLGHELTHVVQQRMSEEHRGEISREGDPGEMEAEKVEDALLSGYPIPEVAASAAAVSRQEIPVEVRNVPEADVCSAEER